MQTPKLNDWQIPRSSSQAFRSSRRFGTTRAYQANLLTGVLASFLLATAPAYAIQHEGPEVEVEVPRTSKPFPFTITGDRFYIDGSPVFLNIVCYQALEPGQDTDDAINENRVLDDLRRLQAYRGGTDPVLLRVYPQPSAAYPNRLPQSFYDGIRELGFWLIRDIYFPSEDCNDAEGRAAVDAVIAEVEAADALDLVFAWEFGNEYQDAPCTCGNLSAYLSAMCDHIKQCMAIPGREDYSDFVTWASYPPHDSLYTAIQACAIDTPCFDYLSINAYPYWPEHVRDHQGGQASGSPYAGYLTAIKDRILEDYPGGKPLVVSEAGLADSLQVGGGGQQAFLPWYPQYRWGGLNADQVAEGVSDLYWDARLAGVAGLAFFEWNDEWWKAGDPSTHNDAPEEFFGMVSFDKHTSGVPENARYKLQQETVRSLFTLRLPSDGVTNDITPSVTSISAGGSTQITADVTGATLPVRFRWETSRGRIVGDSSTVVLQAGGHALGAADVVAVAMDAHGQASIASTVVNISPVGDPSLTLLTLGQGPQETGRASGRVANVSLAEYKVIVYIEVNTPTWQRLYVQPRNDMTRIWIRPDGYWWTQITNLDDGALLAWLVPSAYEPPNEAPLGWEPPESEPGVPGYVAAARLDGVNDVDNDLLPDEDWEIHYWGDLAMGRYDDPDEDLANNLEEFLLSTDPTNDDNDSDSDSLPDTWELRYFGTLAFNAEDDPDNDSLDNFAELSFSTHPGRTAVDRDQDEMPDTWEVYWFHDLDQLANADPDGSGFTNLDAYELGLAPFWVCDLNADLAIDDLDCDLLAAAFGRTFGESEYLPRADIDHDGVICLRDYDAWLSCYRDAVGDPSASLPCAWDPGCDNVPDFIAQLLAESPESPQVCRFDQNGDGRLDGIDIEQFVDRLLD